MPTIYSNAETAEAIATRIIPNAHPHLGTARIKYVFRDVAAKEGGKPLGGKARKISGINEFLIGCDFVIEVAYDLWNGMGDEQREALIDHLLTYCFGEEDEKDPGAGMKWSIRRPDVKEFTEVLNRRGKWNEGLGEFVDAAKALPDGPSFAEEEEQESASESSSDDVLAPLCRRRLCSIPSTAPVLLRMSWVRRVL